MLQKTNKQNPKQPHQARKYKQKPNQTNRKNNRKRGLGNYPRLKINSRNKSNMSFDWIVSLSYKNEIEENTKIVI